MNPGRRTAIFAKEPTPGAVKTRLCPPLTWEEAARLAEAMLRDTVARCRSGAFETELVFAPPAAAGWFRSVFPEVVLQRPQEGPDLGARLARYFAEVFARGEARSLVAVGSDQPLVPRARIEEAHAALEGGAECVLGPDLGGGYYLVGLTLSVPELFTEAPLSSAGTYAATVALARARDLRLVELAAHGDVDTPVDLARLRAALVRPSPCEDPDFPRRTRRALEELSLLP